MTASFGHPSTSWGNCPASKCIDGDHTTMRNCDYSSSSMCHSAGGDDIYFTLDFGTTTTTVQKVIVYTRLDTCCQADGNCRNILGQHEIWIGDSSAAPTRNTLLCSSMDARGGLVLEHVCTPNAGIPGRYVFVLFPGYGRLINLQEVEVYGSTDLSTAASSTTASPTSTSPNFFNGQLDV